MRTLAQSVRMVRDNPLLVLLMACTSLYVTCHSTTLFLWVSLAASIVLTPAIYGRCAQLVIGEGPSSLIRLFARHGLNFYIVIVLFFLPVVAALFLVRKDLAASYLNAAFAVEQVLLIYVLPNIFFMRSPVAAITSGLSFLGRNSGLSLPLAGLALLGPILHLAIPSGWIALDLSSFKAAALTLPFSLFYNVIVSTANLTLFIAAGIVLLARSPEAAGGSA